ncbi:GNAT family N-acetyltransferase [Candidatus Fermentibacteria bacterium]|nr:GNAT family N-acetyltransferase [Candidatus Fermentibacteria bacterium]
MNIVIEEIGADRYSLYDGIPARYTVESVFKVEVLDGGLGGFRLAEEKVATPYIKDYDGHGEHRPSRWASEFDMSRWGILLARDGERHVGGAAIAVGTAVYPLDRFQRNDLAVLWDIRVTPEERGRGIGRRLFRAAAGWARERGFGQLGLETQSVNVPACRFYSSAGCELGAIHRYGYVGCPEVAHEAMLLWYLEL